MLSSLLCEVQREETKGLQREGKARTHAGGYTRCHVEGSVQASTSRCSVCKPMPPICTLGKAHTVTQAFLG